MAAVSIHKWTVRFFLVFLIYPSANARGGHLDWIELADEIVHQQWCGTTDYCGFRNQSDDPATTESSTNEGLRKMTVQKPNDMKENQFLNTACHCDEECDSYGDCCYDALLANIHTEVKNNISEEEFEQNSLACLPLRFKDNDYKLDEKFHIYMINACPSTWVEDDDESLPALCRKSPNRLDYTHLIDIPVLSLETNRTYANVFCARCHSDANRLASWNVSVECDVDINTSNATRAQMFRPSNYQPGLRQWALVVNEDDGEDENEGTRTTIRCNLVVDEFRNFMNYLKSTGSRRCIPRIESCAEDWTDTSDEIKCQSYTFLVQEKHPSGYTKPRVYKNPHCAKCNHIPHNETDCFFTQQTIDKFRVALGNRNRYSFSMLIDFDFGGGAGGKVDHVCGPNEIFDRFRDRCHAVVCGATFVNEAGTCVRKSELENNWPTAGTWLNSSCQRVILMENVDYIQLENGSLILKANGKTLQPEEYEPSPGGQNVTICADDDQADTYFKYSAGQRYLSDICLAISVCCLALHIAIHIALPKLRNLPGKNLLSLSCALFVAQLLFLTGIGLRDVVGYGWCAFLGVATHWFYLAAFFWMNIMGFDICRTFTGSLTRNRGMPGRGQRSTFIFYSLYAWGFPTAIVSLGLMLDFTDLVDDYAPEYGYRVCWISNKAGLGVFFVLPVAVLLLENLILFSLTVFSIIKQRQAAQFAVEKNQSYRAANEAKTMTERLQPPSGPSAPLRRNSAVNNKQQIRFILYIKLGLIMGLGWIFGFVAALAKMPVLWYPFILFNALQGAFIFVAFCCKRKIYFMVYKWATKRPHPSDSSSSSRATASTNKPSISTHKSSIATPSSTTAEFESQSNRLSVVQRDNQPPVRQSYSQHS
ncbi:hypothetical protein OUZ56_002208 [Daphnia magna]|uniref:G-protein coupled receptors family 2 profile 2 domain-containing protein n=1 Tax=Daphnia magna TaxID=35525 RepID=A0ABR0A4Z3_9CRUS|nr:hypothetical protein OUZ56_002208 [Daphnia magna]